MTTTATFIIHYKPPPASTGGTGRLTFSDTGARDFEGTPEGEEAVCEAVRKFINDYYGWECVASVEVERDE